MKAVVIYKTGQPPQYTDFAEPIAKNDAEVIIDVKAVAIKHLDKSLSSGKHYSSDTPKDGGRVIGGDGVGVLADGTRVYGMAVNGMLGEKAAIYKERMVAIPDGLNNITAAALPNAVIGAAMGLKFKANIQPGDVVLINGATGFTGHVAVQIAKHYGAKKVIVSGRNPKSLNNLLLLGGDEIISVLQDDESFKTQLANIQMCTPIDVVIDYLWGHTAEMILTCFKGSGSFTNKVRYVSVGSMSGDIIQLSAANLRSVDIQLTGSGLGAWSKQQVGELFSKILPQMFQLAASGKLKIETMEVKMDNVEQLWEVDVPDGQRIVVSVL